MYSKKYTEVEISESTGELISSDDNWMIETDGTDLKHILQVQRLDFTRTTSNDICEIKNVLGIEAARQSLVNEFRNVLNHYGIYVNYRHLSTLVDTMT